MSVKQNKLKDIDNKKFELPKHDRWMILIYWISSYKSSMWKEEKNNNVEIDWKKRGKLA